MQYQFNTYKRVKTIWGQLIHLSLTAAHPAGTWFKTTTKEKRTVRRSTPLLQSPDSVHLRGAHKKDPQRKNPAP